LPTRRQTLNRLVVGSVGASGLFGGCANVNSRAKTKSDIVKPHALRTGQTIGLIAPGGYVTAAQVQRSRDNLNQLGFSVKQAPNLFAQWGGYAGTIEQRVDAFHQMYFDDSVSALWAVRGGSGTLGLLPHLNYTAIRAKPKAVIGYSDITALHLALLAKAGMVSFHGPVASSTFAPASVEAIRTILMNSHKDSELTLLAPHANQYRPITAGKAEGRLVGGNLSLVCALIGTGFLPQLQNANLFLEDVGEPPYKVDRLLHQLLLYCPANQLNSVALGLFTKTEPSDNDPSLSFSQVIDQHLAGQKTPAGYGFSFGHIAPQWTIPVGVNASVDTQRGTINLLEAAVEPA
jgi:muramoyltetrapeptide carboxypeptidase